MAIIKMKRLSVVVAKEKARSALRSLTALGCVELRQQNAEQLIALSPQLNISEENTGAADSLSSLKKAAALLQTLPNQKKTPLFSPRPQMTEKSLFDAALLKEAVFEAELINQIGAKIEQASDRQAKIYSRMAALKPWLKLDCPLDFRKTEKTRFFFGSLPAAADIDSLTEKLSEQAPYSILVTVNSDSEQSYITLLAHISEAENALSLMKSAGFSPAEFETANTAEQEITLLEQQISELSNLKESLKTELGGYLDTLPRIKTAIDAFEQEKRRDELLSKAGRTKNTVFLTGWVPENAEKAVADSLQKAGCAYSFDEPDEGDEPPVLMQNADFIDPVVSVTEMYGVPAYNSIVDPNPTMYPFYVAFFGFIMADAGYGILMFLGCWLALRLMKPTGGMRRMLRLFMHCGAATTFAGILFGGWFADAIKVFSETFLGVSFAIPPLWFDPLSDPMTMLIFSLGLGAVHLLTAMALSAYRMIKRGNTADAVFDVGSWYLLFIGLGLFALKIPAGKYISILGVLMLLFAGSRGKKGFGKLTGAFGNIYGITGYLSDLLSYSRIMALGLSGAVVGQVMNKIGTLAGGGIFGVIFFAVIFLIGHTFNLAISLLGAYVHKGRLQYIEFFGKFFEGGGRLFSPLCNNTKYVDVIRED
ncbi:MAG: V-type ATP synthase subunit I [Oscillospiraceae bacterium]|nr:V-type ATP synthase subunit I [Oscillospiraceae bacterium]